MCPNNCPIVRTSGVARYEYRFSGILSADRITNCEICVNRVCELWMNGFASGFACPNASAEPAAHIRNAFKKIFILITLTYCFSNLPETRHVPREAETGLSAAPAACAGSGSAVAAARYPHRYHSRYRADRAS